MSRRLPLKRSVAIATARPMPKPMTGSLVAVVAAGAFFVNPVLGLGIIGLALWQTLGE
ncbi:hypothetical protein D3C87_488670 [compost metagenome]